MSGFPPAVEAVHAGRTRPVTCRNVGPGHTRPQPPKDAVQNLSVVGTLHPRTFVGSRGRITAHSKSVRSKRAMTTSPIAGSESQPSPIGNPIYGYVTSSPVAGLVRSAAPAATRLPDRAGPAGGDLPGGSVAAAARQLVAQRPAGDRHGFRLHLRADARCGVPSYRPASGLSVGLPVLSLHANTALEWTGPALISLGAVRVFRLSGR